MNKRGQESYITLTGAELVFLVIFASMFGFIALKGVEEYRINQIKSEGLGLSISSVFIIDGDVNLNYDLGTENQVEVLSNSVRVYKSSKGKIGVSELSLDDGYNLK